MKGLFHMSVAIMLSLGGLLLKLLVLPNISLGDFFYFLCSFPYTSSPFLGLAKPDGVGSGLQRCSLQCRKAVHQGSGEGPRT